MKEKDWTCNNQCKSNCCSELFLPLDDIQKESYLEKGYYFADSKYSDWRWLNYHKSLTLEKLKGGWRKITIDQRYKPKIIFAPPIKKDVLYIKDECIQLLNTNKCRIYRIRPKTCRTSKCPVFEDKDEMIIFVGKISMKELRKKYESGELKK